MSLEVLLIFIFELHSISCRHCNVAGKMYMRTFIFGLLKIAFEIETKRLTKYVGEEVEKSSKFSNFSKISRLVRLYLMDLIQNIFCGPAYVIL